MVTQHSAITDPNIHEPKGVAEADSGMVYVADGAGSGDWQIPFTLVETRTLTGATSEEFTGLSGYNKLWIIGCGIQCTTTQDLLIQFSTASTYRTSGYFDGKVNASASTVTDSDGSGIKLGTYDQAYGIFVAVVSNLNSSAAPTTVESSFWASSIDFANNYATDTSVAMNTFGYYPTLEAHEKIKILASGGSTLAGSTNSYLSVYGL